MALWTLAGQFNKVNLFSFIHDICKHQKNAA